MTVTLDQVLGFVGKLDDSPGDDTARERFRRFLRENVKEVGRVRDYIEDCLRKTGDQYNRALQDLVNYLGQLMEFDVAFGRYHGVQGKIGFDGHWQSPTGFHVVAEVKTTEAYQDVNKLGQSCPYTKDCLDKIKIYQSDKTPVHCSDNN